MRSVLVLIVIVLAARCCFAQSARPQILAQVRLSPHLGAQLPLDVPLIDEEGRPTSLRSVMEGKPTILVFAWYRCPMLCTEILNGMTRALIELDQAAGSDFEVVVVSIDPSETAEMAVEKKKTYLQRYGRPGAEKGFHFLVGPRRSIARLTAAMGFHYAYDEASKQYAHPSGLLILTPQGRLSRCLMGIQFIANDVRLSLVEASNGSIGTLVEKIQLLCFQYDPSTGKYGVWIFGIVRAASLLTLVVMGVAIWRATRKDLHASAD
jgi:protein SCO1/2